MESKQVLSFLVDEKLTRTHENRETKAKAKKTPIRTEDTAYRKPSPTTALLLNAYYSTFDTSRSRAALKMLSKSLSAISQRVSAR